MTKKNDWVAVLLLNDDNLKFEDVVLHGITPDNTSIESEDYYKNLDIVKEKFSDENGKFDDSKFDKFYNSALASYNKYAESSFEDEILKTLPRDRLDISDPTNNNIIDYSATISTIKYNPDRRTIGIGALGEIGTPSFSIREVAQANNVRDKDGNKLDWTPNDKGGLFKSLSRPTLALASWDEDGTHNANGVDVNHKKGDLKFDDNGDPYYEELEKGEEIYGKDILHWTDTITVDGSKLNSVDFLDSDGISKSALGTIVKTTAILAPLMIPGVGQVYGTIKAINDLIEVMPTLGKVINGIVTGSNDNKIGNALTYAENYLSRFTSTVSDYSRDRFLSVENIGNIFSESAGQLFAQKQIGNIARKILSGGDTLKNAKIAQNLSLGYMALTSSRDAYGQVKQAGASDRTAGLVSLALGSALFGLMSQDYFRDFLFKDTYLTQSEVRDAEKAFENIIKEEIIGRIPEDIPDTKGGAKFLNKAISKFTNIFKRPEGENLIKSLWYGSMNEGTEEVMEEVAFDAIKGTFKTLEWLGIPMTDAKDKTLNFGITPEDMIQRYASSFFGGFLGGLTFEGYNQWDSRNIPKVDYEKISKDHKLQAQMMYLISTGHGQDLEDLAIYRAGKNRMGNKNLSAKIENGRWVTRDGNKKFVWAQGTDTDNQNLAVANRVISDIKYWRYMIENQGIITHAKRNVELMKDTQAFMDEAEENGVTVEELLNIKGSNPIIDYIFKTGLDTSTVLDDIIDLNTRIIKVSGELDAAKKAVKEEDTEGNVNHLNKVKSDYNKLAKERDELISGKKNHLYAEQIMFTADGLLMDLLFSDASDGRIKPFVGANVRTYVLSKYNKKWNELSEEDKKAYDIEFNNYVKDKDIKSKIKNAFKIFSGFNKQITPILLSIDDKYKNANLNDYFQEKDKYQVSLFDKWFISKSNQEILLKAIPDLKAKLEVETDENKKQEIQKNINEGEKELKDVENNIKNLESELSMFFERSFTQKGTEEYLKKVSDIISKNDVSINDLVEALNHSEDYYKQLIDNNKIDYNDAVLQNILLKVKDIINYNGSIYDNINYAITNSDLDEELFNEVLGEDVINYINLQKEDYFKQVSLLNINSANKARNNIKERLKIRIEDTSNLDLDKITDDIIWGEGVKIKNKIDEIIELKKDTLKSPIVELIENYGIPTNESVIDIFKLLENQKNTLISSGTPEQYIYESKDIENNLKTAVSLLNLIQSTVYSSTSGYNSTVNSFNRDKSTHLAEISENTGNILFTDIDYLRKNIRNLITLAESNTSDKTKIQKEIELRVYPRFVSSLIRGINLPPDNTSESNASTFNTLFLNNGVTIENLWNESLQESDIPDIDIEGNITEDQYINLRKAIYKFEKKIYNNTRSLSNEDIISKVIELYPNFYKREQSNFNDKDYKTTDYQSMMYLLSILSVDPEEFYNKYNKITFDEDEQFTPFYNQEIVIRELYAFVKNRELFNELIKKLKDNLTKNYEGNAYVENMISSFNSIFVDGGTGTGKTSAVAHYLVKLLNPEDNLIVAAPNKNLIDDDSPLSKLVSDANHKMLISDLLNKLYNNFEEIKKYNKEGSGHNERYEEEDLKKSINNINDIEEIFNGAGTSYEKIIIIDEGSWISESEAQALSFAANKNDIQIIYLGDGTQDSQFDKDNPTNFFDTSGIVTINLSESIRAENLCKINNYRSLRNPLSKTTNQLIVDLSKFNKDDADKIFDSYLLNSKLTLTYNNSQDKFSGEVIVENKDDAKKYLNVIKELPNAKKIAIITDEDRADNWSTYNGNNKQIEVITNKDVRGCEYDYVIIDHDFSKRNGKNKYLISRDLYTLINRSKYGSVIIDAENNLGSFIVNNNDPLGSNTTSVSNVAEQYKEWKKNVLNFLENKKEKPSKKEDDTNEGEEGEDGNTDEEGNEETTDKEEKETPENTEGKPVIVPYTSSLKKEEDIEISVEERRKLIPETGENSTLVVEKAIDKVKSNTEVLDNRHKEIISLGGKTIDYLQFMSFMEGQNILGKKVTNSFETYIKSHLQVLGLSSLNDRDIEEAKNLIKYISSIVIDNIHEKNGLYNINGGLHNRELQNVWNDFKSYWDNTSRDRIYKFERLNGNEFLTSISIGNLQIPVFIINSDENLSGKYLCAKYRSKPFIMYKDYDFTTKSKCFLKLYKNNPTNLGSFKNFIDYIVGIFAPDNKNNQYLSDPITGKDSLTKIFAKSNSGKTFAAITYNEYKRQHHLEDYFKFKKTRDGEIVYFTQEDPNIAQIGIEHNITLYDLFNICNMIMYITRNGNAYNLVLNHVSITNRNDAIQYLKKYIGDIGLQLLVDSDKDRDRNAKKENFANLRKHPLLDHKVIRSLISNLYALTKSTGSAISGQKLTGFLDLYTNFYEKPGQDTKWGYDFQVQNDKGEIKHFWVDTTLEEISGGPVNSNNITFWIHEEDTQFRFNENSRAKITVNINKSNVVDEFWNWIIKQRDYISLKKSYTDISDAIFKKGFSVTAKKQVTYPADTKWYDADAYELVYLILKGSGINLAQAYKALLTTDAFNNGIYLNDIGNQLFRNSQYKQSKLSKDQLDNEMTSDYNLILPPVYYIKGNLKNISETTDETESGDTEHQLSNDIRDKYISDCYTIFNDLFTRARDSFEYTSDNLDDDDVNDYLDKVREYIRELFYNDEELNTLFPKMEQVGLYELKGDNVSSTKTFKKILKYLVNKSYSNQFTVKQNGIDLIVSKKDTTPVEKEENTDNTFGLDGETLKRIEKISMLNPNQISSIQKGEDDIYIVNMRTKISLKINNYDNYIEDLPEKAITLIRSLNGNIRNDFLKRKSELFNEFGKEIMLVVSKYIAWVHQDIDEGCGL